MSDQMLEPPAQQETNAGLRAPASAPAPDPGFAPTSVPSLAAVHALADDAAPAAPAPEAPPPCTQAQLRRFIKSRSYVPLHELRRRFGLNGADDDVAGVDVGGHRIFIGLPERETALLGELLRQGDVGYELLLDPTSPIVIGVFPMRPVQRP
jgi:hypothetical protein